jgi:Protein of unknown function (DUF2911)
MKLGSVTVLTLSLAFVGSGSFFNLTAQDTSVASASDVNRCVKWMRAAVSARALDPTEFCSGIWDGHTGGWDAIFKCGQPTQQLTGTAPKYCASSGQISAGEAWAAGFSSATRYGSDFLGETSDAAKDSQQAAATFYSRTAVWMGSIRVPAGMYKLIPSKSPDGWSLAIAKQDGEWNDAEPSQQDLGSVQMKGSASDNTTGKHNLVISTRRWPDSDVRELHFMYGSTDLFVSIRPEQVPQSQEANISER